MEINDYKIIFTDTAVKRLKSFSYKEKVKIFQKIEDLGKNPLANKNVKKLINFDISYRLRIGDYRVLFERNDEMKIIEIIDIRYRKESYRRN